MDGLAATLAAIAFAFFAIDAVTIHPNDAHLVLALAGACAVRRASCRSTCARAARRSSSWATPARRCSASRSRRSGSRRAGTSPASTVATLLLPILVLAVPILDTTLVTIVRLLEGRPISQGGRDHTSHRLVRFGLSEKHAVAAARADRDRARRDEPRLQRARRPAPRGRRRARHVRAARPVRELPRRRRARAAPSDDGGSSTRSPCTGGGSSRCVVDFALIVGVVRRRLRRPVRLAGHGVPAALRRRSTLPGRCSLRATSPSSRSASTGRLALRGLARRCVAIAAAVVVSEVVALGYVALDAGRSATSRARSSSSTR